MATRYWIGGAGDWVDTANWSASSGGAGGASVPTSADDVVFDSASGASLFSVRFDTFGSGVCNNLTIATSANARVHMPMGTAETLSIYGNLTISASAHASAGVVAESNQLYMAATSGTKTIDTGGKSNVLGDMAISGGATYSLSSNVAATLADEGTTITVSAGTLDINGKTLTVGNITLSGTGNIVFTGGGTIDYPASYQNYGLNFTGSGSYDSARAGTTKFTRGSSHVTAVTKSGAGTLGFGVLRLTNNAGYGAHAWSIPVNTAIGELIIGAPSAADYTTVKLAITGTTILNKITAEGTDNTRQLLQSATAGTRAAVQVLSPLRPAPTYLNIKDLIVTSGGPILAASNCVDGGNNVGVLFGKKLPGFGAML